MINVLAHKLYILIHSISHPDAPYIISSISYAQLQKSQHMLNAEVEDHKTTQLSAASAAAKVSCVFVYPQCVVCVCICI